MAATSRPVLPPDYNAEMRLTIVARMPKFYLAFAIVSFAVAVLLVPLDTHRSFGGGAMNLVGPTIVILPYLVPIAAAGYGLGERRLTIKTLLAFTLAESVALGASAALLRT